MSGHRSRRRGKRGEYLLRNYLRQLGWVADRVPSSGAAQGFKGDVKANRDGLDLTFELKNWSGDFNKIYELYAEHCKLKQDDLLSIVVPGEAKLCLDLSSSLDAVLEGGQTYDVSHPLLPKYKRTFQKLGSLQRLLGESDILVLKDDRRAFLFLKYR